MSSGWPHAGKRTLSECFQLFDLIHRVTTDHATITRIATEVVEDLAADNVIYAELRTTPKASTGLAPDVADHLCMGLRWMFVARLGNELVLGCWRMNCSCVTAPHVWLLPSPLSHAIRRGRSTA